MKITFKDIMTAIMTALIMLCLTIAAVVFIVLVFLILNLMFVMAWNLTGSLVAATIIMIAVAYVVHLIFKISREFHSK